MLTQGDRESPSLFLHADASLNGILKKQKNKKQKLPCFCYQPHFVGLAKHIASATLRVPSGRIAARWNPQLRSGPSATTGRPLAARPVPDKPPRWSLMGRSGAAGSIGPQCGLIGPAAERRQCALLARHKPSIIRGISIVILTWASGLNQFGSIILSLFSKCVNYFIAVFKMC